MNKIAYLTALLLCAHCNLSAQVGIGTDIPTAELEIQTTNTGIPALELNAQTAPTGTAMGQISLIGDRLYMFDGIRNKWLSLESTALQFARNGDADNEILRFGGDARDNNSGPLMPFDGTIVYITVQSSGGVTNKQFDLKINGTDVGNSATASLDGRFQLSGGSFSYTDYNIDFDAGDYINLEVRNNGSDVEDPVAVIWVKWRQ